MAAPRVLGPCSRKAKALSPPTFQLCDAPCMVAPLTTAVMAPPASGVGHLGAVGKDAPAVADAAIALERQIVAVLVTLGTEQAWVDGRYAADLFLALAQC